MAAVNLPYTTNSLVADESKAKVDQPRVLIVGAIPTANNGIFQAGETAKLLQKSESVSYESESKSNMAALIGSGWTYLRWEAAKEASNNTVPIDLLLVKNDTAGATTTTITLAANPTSDNRLKITAAYGRRFFADVEFSAGDDVADIATAAVQQLNNEVIRPFIASSVGGVITLTWVDDYIPDSTPIHVLTDDQALAPTVANTGAIAPDQPLSDLFDTVGDTKYTHVLWPDYFFSTIAIVDDFYEARFNEFNQVRSGAAFSTLTDTEINVRNATQSINSQHLCIHVANKVDGLFGTGLIGANSSRLPDADIANRATTHALMLTDGADLSSVGYIASGLKDYRGGIAMASFPFHNIPIKDTAPTSHRWYFTHEAQKRLNDSGLSTYGTNRTGSDVIGGNALTLWKFDAQGNVNKTWSQLEFLYTSLMIKFYWDARLRVEYGNKRMTNGELVSDRSMVNEISIREFAALVNNELGELTLVTAGKVATDKFLAGLVVEQFPSDTKFSILATHEIVTHVGIIDNVFRITQQY